MKLFYKSILFFSITGICALSMPTILVAQNDTVKIDQVIVKGKKFKVEFDKPVLDDKNQIAVEEDPDKGTPALLANKGVLDDFSGEIYSWWVGNDQLTLSRKADTLKVVAKSVGPKYTPFGKEFALLDMKEAGVLKVRMRAEGSNPPLVGISLKDVNAYDTNADRPKAKIKISSEYSDYYFNYTDKWKQGWPVSAKVDETMIREIMFFINPGGAEWTGTLYVDGITIIRESDMPKVEVTAGGIVDDFSEEIYSWWSSSDKVALERINDVLNITCAEAGPGYETFGKGIDPVNMSGEYNVLRVKAKAEGATAHLRINLKDKTGLVNNESPVIKQIEVTPDFVNYYYEFKGTWKQSWPDAQVVNAEAIQELLIFINTGGQPSPYTGKLLIDEMEIITEKQMNELKAAGK